MTDLHKARRELVKQGVDLDQFQSEEEILDYFNRQIMQQATRGVSAQPLPPAAKLIDDPAEITKKITEATMTGGLPEATKVTQQFIGQLIQKAKDQESQAYKHQLEEEEKRLNAKLKTELAKATENLTPEIIEKEVVKTVRVDQNGQVIKTASTVKGTGLKSVDTLWPDISLKVEVPTADHPAAPQYYNLNSLHSRGYLSLICNAVRRGRHLWFAGDAATGKTSFARHFADSCGRPFFRISHFQDMDVLDLIGNRIPNDQQQFVWSDGALTEAIRTPFAVILLDEPTLSVVACQIYQTLLDEGFLTIAATGEVVPLAEGVTFFAADNTTGHGDETGRYDGTAPINKATIDRFSHIIPFDYMEKGDEVHALQHHTGVTRKRANNLVNFAHLSRQSRDIDEPVTFRRLIALTEALMDGIPTTRAVETAVLSHIRNEQDREAIRMLAVSEIN